MRTKSGASNWIRIGFPVAVVEEEELSAVPFKRVILASRQVFVGNVILPWTSYKGIVLFDGNCGAMDTRLITIRLGSVTFHYLFLVSATEKNTRNNYSPTWNAAFNTLKRCCAHCYFS